jgi:hypothetical protein
MKSAMMATCGEAEERRFEGRSAWLAFRLGTREVKWVV